MFRKELKVVLARGNFRETTTLEMEKKESGGGTLLIRQSTRRILLYSWTDYKYTREHL